MLSSKSGLSESTAVPPMYSFSSIGCPLSAPSLLSYKLFVELKNLIKDANIPCPENSITAIIKIININFF